MFACVKTLQSLTSKCSFTLGPPAVQGLSAGYLLLCYTLNRAGYKTQKPQYSTIVHCDELIAETIPRRYQSVRDHISTTSETKPPKYSAYESNVNRAAAVVANTPTKSALHATLQGDYQPANNSADTSGKFKYYCGSFTLPETDSDTDSDPNSPVLQGDREQGPESESVKCELVLHSTM